MADELQAQPDPPRPGGHPLTPRRKPAPARSETGPEERYPRRGNRHDDHEEDENYPAPAPAPIRERRFSRSGTIKGEDSLNDLLNGARPPGLPPVAPAAAEAAEAAARPAAAPVSRVSVPRPAGVPVRAHRRTILLVLGVGQVFALGMLALGFAVGWLIFSDRPAATGPLPAAHGTPAAITDATQVQPPMMAEDADFQSVDAALKAQADNDGDKVNQLYDEMRRRNLPLYGLNYRLGLLAISRMDVTECELRLRRSIKQNEEIFPSYYALATFPGAKGDYTNTARIFDTASHALPFASLPFFCWGECLRRDGKPQAAIARLEEALLRPLLPADADYIRFKRDLTRVETADQDFIKEIVEKSNAASVPGDTWMLLAANDLGQSAFPAAADHLRRAAKAYPPDEFALKIADYVFQSARSHAELTPIMAKRLPNPTTDPAAWGIKESDPAIWPEPTLSVHQ